MVNVCDQPCHCYCPSTMHVFPPSVTGRFQLLPHVTSSSSCPVFRAHLKTYLNAIFFLLISYNACTVTCLFFWFMPCLKDLMCFEWLQVWVPFSLVGYLVSPSSMCSLSRNVCFLHSWRKKTKGSQLIQVIRQRPINWRWAHVAINFSRKQADLSSP